LNVFGSADVLKSLKGWKMFERTSPLEAEIPQLTNFAIKTGDIENADADLRRCKSSSQSNCGDLGAGEAER